MCGDMHTIPEINYDIFDYITFSTVSIRIFINMQK